MHGCCSVASEHVYQASGLFCIAHASHCEPAVQARVTAEGCEVHGLVGLCTKHLQAARANTMATWTDSALTLHMHMCQIRKSVLASFLHMMLQCTGFTCYAKLCGCARLPGAHSMRNGGVQYGVAAAMLPASFWPNDLWRCRWVHRLSGDSSANTHSLRCGCSRTGL